MKSKILSLLKLISHQLDRLLFEDQAKIFADFCKTHSKYAKRIIEKYEKQFKPLSKGLIISFELFFVLVFLYFFPSTLYSKHGFIPINEKSLQDILQLLFTVVGVIFGVYLQQFLQLLWVPDKEVMYPLEKDSLFPEYLAVLEEFAEKLAADKKGSINNKDTSITILLSCPILIDFDEVEDIIGPDADRKKLKYIKYLTDIFNKGSNIEKKIICLDINPHTYQGTSPLQRFIKSFSGYMITDLHRRKKIPENDNTQFYNDFDKFRRNLTERIYNFCENDLFKSHFLFAMEDDLQWQAIVIQVPSIRFHKAVVGFYGEDFFKKYSRLGLMGSINTKMPMIAPGNQGFVSDFPDIIQWVMSGLISPYIPDVIKPVKIPVHHSSDVHKKISETYPKSESTETFNVMLDNLKCLYNKKVEYQHKPNLILAKIQYPLYDGSNKEPDPIEYCQQLFHPLIAESATWSSLNIRLPGQNKGKVLDMCCGIGVQGLAALDKGASSVHGVDNDPIALACTIKNYKEKVEKMTATEGPEISITLSEGFDDDECYSFDKFKDKFFKIIKAPKWNGNILNQKSKEELENLFTLNEDFINKIYKNTIDNDFDLIILEPPFVDFTLDPISPSHESLYDCHFKVVRSLLEKAKKHLRQPFSHLDWEKPYILQSFSSIEDIIEFETYIEEILNYKIFRKTCVQKNEIFWYCYHLIPN